MIPAICLTDIDIASVLKTAQAISGIIDLDELISTFSKIILENAGAKKCVLILPDKDEWYIRAITSLSLDKNAFTTILTLQPLDDSQEVPLKLIRHVKHKLETVALNNCQSNIGGVIDKYMQQYQPASVLCMPILNQGNLLGILYLENHLTQGVFSRERLLLLNLLCTQAAISLENARLNKKLKESQARFQRLADNVPGMIFQLCLTSEGSVFIPYASSGSHNLYEVTAEEIMAGTQNIRAMEHPDDVADINRAMMESAKNLTPFVHEWRIITPSGNLKWVQGVSHPQLQGDGTITMIQSEKMSSLGQLVAGVAHEINNPVNFIHGNLSYIEQYTQDLLKLVELYQQKKSNTYLEIQDLLDELDLDFIQEDLPKTLKSMKVGTQRIREIVLSLRNFSRMDEAEFKEVNIHEGIDSTLLILQHRLKEKAEHPAIQVIKDYANLPLVKCYAGQLNQVFMNILTNSIDAIEELNSKYTLEDIQANPNKITIRTALVDTNWIEIAIADKFTTWSGALTG